MKPMRVLVKVGGAQLDTAEGRRGLAAALAQAIERGHRPILVHGGGPQIAALGRRLGVEERRWRGLRITDAATAEAVQLALAGGVNKTLVQALVAAGLPAVGLCGADGGLIAARRVRGVDPSGAEVDLGYVGEPAEVRGALIETLLAGGFLPVIATVAPEAGAPGDAPLLNINADQAAGPLARACAAQAVLFLTDVPAVLDADGRPLADLDPARSAELEAAGVISGGMLPKVAAALAAVDAAPAARVVIAPGRGADGSGRGAVLDALEGRTGTRFSARPESPAREAVPHG